MNTNLTKVGGKWAIEITGSDDEEMLTKSFASVEEAEKWRHDVGQGIIPAPVLNSKRARTDKGSFKGDDPKTPDTNEAYRTGKAPKKKASKTTKKK
tara:strand:+ start:533 stop:820 length:288 start_codon:yes stop_codon:yes gene_type:complete